MDNLDRALEQIELLRQMGVRFAIDDFGTGYSSLSHLRTLPVDCVKIDRSFIKDLAQQGSGSTTLVRGIIGLAHNLELQVVAEGVETQEQLSLLQGMGCDINQGFFLHRPMPRDAVEKLFGLAAPAPKLLDEVVLSGPV
jgi:EAL domain-containing protein (putative c-di-GMP-specific phosphodiesterase class I)